MPDRQVTITMNVNTVNALANDGYLLYGFKPIAGGGAGGRPLVWFAMQSYSPNTFVSWSQQYNAFTSQSPVAPKSQVSPGFSATIQAGQTLQVTSGTGIGTVVDQGPAGKISIYNTTTTPLTCGIAQALTGAAAAPYCAFPLYGLNQESLTPVDGLLLIFSTSVVAPGTVIEDSLNDASSATNLDRRLPGTVLFAISQSLSIDLGGAASCSVSYDLNQGWSWAAGVQAKTVPANADLVPLLILPS